MPVIQLLRGGPGYGGVERVAHELASLWQGPVFSLMCNVSLSSVMTLCQ